MPQLCDRSSIDINLKWPWRTGWRDMTRSKLKNVIIKITLKGESLGLGTTSLSSSQQVGAIAMEIKANALDINQNLVNALIRIFPNHLNNQ